MLNFDYTLNITKPKVILQKQQDYLTKGNGIRELPRIFMMIFCLSGVVIKMRGNVLWLDVGRLSKHHRPLLPPSLLRRYNFLSGGKNESAKRTIMSPPRLPSHPPYVLASVRFSYRYPDTSKEGERGRCRLSCWCVPRRLALRSR